MVVSRVFVYVESVQRRSARFVMNDHRQTSSVTSMLNTLQWQLISERRTRCKAVMMSTVIYWQLKIAGCALETITHLHYPKLLLNQVR